MALLLKAPLVNKSSSMDTFAKKNEKGYVYQTIPENIRKTLDRTQPTETQSDFGNAIEFVSKFVQNKVTSCDLDDIKTAMKKPFLMNASKPGKPSKKVRHKKFLLTSIEKRKLGLQKLPKTGLKYISFSALHNLWLGYIEHFLDLKTSTAGPNQEQLHLHLAKADYHGCLLMVSRSKCPSYVGVKGIVIMETKNTFQIICHDDTVKIIPKRDSVFTFNIQKWTFTLFGNSLNIRPSERASKKFKSKSTIDF